MSTYQRCREERRFNKHKTNLNKYKSHTHSLTDSLITIRSFYSSLNNNGFSNLIPMVPFSIAIGAPFQYDVLGAMRVMVVVAGGTSSRTKPHAKF